MIIPSEELKQICLKEIDEFLHPNGKALAHYECMPKIIDASSHLYDNLLLVNELSYDCDEMLVIHMATLSVLLRIILVLCFLLMAMGRLIFGRRCPFASVLKAKLY